MSDIWEKDNFVNTNIFYLFNNEIIEYDLKEAGFSISKEFSYLSKSDIEKLSLMSKDKRHKKLGLLQREDEDFKENLKTGFILARKRFIEDNNLSIDEIIDIKKDAIFTTRICNTEKVGEHLLFRPKNKYTSYIRLSRLIEIFYGENVDIKGISDENINLHKDFILKIICQFINKMETDSKENAVKYLVKMTDKYKWKELELGFYRTFDARSIFELTDESQDDIVSVYDIGLDNINIDFNFENVLLKLLKIPI